MKYERKKGGEKKKGGAVRTHANWSRNMIVRWQLSSVNLLFSSEGGGKKGEKRGRSTRGRSGNSKSRTHDFERHSIYVIESRVCASQEEKRGKRKKGGEACISNPITWLLYSLVFHCNILGREGGGKGGGDFIFRGKIFYNYKIVYLFRH